MNYRHKELAEGRWNTFSLVEQMAHVGSEVSRALNWKEKGNQAYSDRALERGLELLSLTVDDPKNKGRLKEILRVREALLDYFAGTNEFASSAESWRKYFLGFAYAARSHT